MPFWTTRGHNRAVTLAAPAKINTFLAVGPPDARGWHPLRTVFQEIDLADAITLEPAERDEVTFSVEGVPAENTVTKALRLLRERVEIPPLRVRVEKRIPSEAGLGGGSADAGAILRHFGVGLPPAELRAMALRIGADVPFSLLGGRARGEGYGEVLTPLPGLPPRPLVLAKPAEGCPTPEMFRLLDAKPREFREFPEEDVLHNDFERVAPCASLDLIERLLVHGADDAALTGSGSAVFGRFADEGAARRAAGKLGSEAPWVQVAGTVMRKQA